MLLAWPWQEQRAWHQTLGYLLPGIEGWELEAGPWRQLAAPAHAALCSESVLQEQTGAQGDVLASPWVCQGRVTLKLLAARPCPLSCWVCANPNAAGRGKPVSGVGWLTVMEHQGLNPTEFPASPRKGRGTVFLDRSVMFS